MTVQLAYTDPVIVASGAPGKISYSYDITQARWTMNAELSSPTFDQNQTIDTVFHDLKGQTRAGDGISEPVTVTLQMPRTETQSVVDQDGVRTTTEGVSLGAEMSGSFLPAANPGGHPTGHLQATVASAEGVIAVQSPDLSYSAYYTTQTYDSTLTLTDTKGRLDGEIADVTVDVAVPMIPVPLGGSLDRATLGASVDLTQQASVDRVGMAMDLAGLVLDDAVWGLFDPAGHIPRTAARLQFDVAMGFDEPLSSKLSELNAPNTVDISSAVLAIGGAMLQANGAFAFSSIAPGTPPQPMGTLTATLDGGNALLDAVTSTGLVPPEQMMGARMMLGMFAVPDGPGDRMKTVVDVTPDGGVTVNGVRVK